MKISVKDSLPKCNGNMLRRKSLSLDKSPVNKNERPERRSSVAAGLLGYKERLTVPLVLEKSQPDKVSKNERRGSLSGTGTEIKERRGSIVQRYDDIQKSALIM